MRLPMGSLLNFAMLLLRCLPAIVRSRNEQALVELALRQQFATYAQKGTKPTMTPDGRRFFAITETASPRWTSSSCPLCVLFIHPAEPK